MRTSLLATSLLLTLSASGPAFAQAAPRQIRAAPTIPPAEAWEIGPFINGRNRSLGMPVNPIPTRGGWYFDFPYPTVEAGHVHYVTYRTRPLAGATRIVMLYRIDAARGTRFIPQERPDDIATISIFFQRRGDRWSGKGKYAFYRWWSPERTLSQIRPGEYEIVVNFRDPEWISIWGGTSGANPREFDDALNDTDRVGFVLGSNAARGHGVYATGPARFTLIDYRVE